MSPERSSDVPPTKIGRLADAALSAIESHREGEGVRVVVFVEDDLNCVTALGGWDSDHEAIAAVFAHLAAVFKANGQELKIIPLIDHD